MDYVHELLIDNGETVYKDIDGELIEKKYRDKTFRKDSDKLQYLNFKFN